MTGLSIELVHSYPHLYDKKRSDFNDGAKKGNSWREIGDLLKYPDEFSVYVCESI